MKVSSNNDWDPLVEVIVGIADNARIPTMDDSTVSFTYADCSLDAARALEGPISQTVIDEANEDIEALVDVLRRLGVIVHRPLKLDSEKMFTTPEWSTTGYHTWCPRDLLLPLDNLVIECPSPMRSRYFETRAYRHLMFDAIRDGVQWISAPKPILGDDAYTFEDLTKPTLRNTEPIFDAPNVVRLGRDLLFQISNSGNLMGLDWLRTILEPRGYRLHPAEGVYNHPHFDSTIVPLRPGLVLLNRGRVNGSNCPKLLKKWDKIYFDDVEGFRTPPKPGDELLSCTPYIGLNVFSIRPDLVCLDRIELSLIREIERHGITCVPLPMRHSRALGGGFHCATLDLIRSGPLEDYFC
jgi:N-dimethylarginine dimethylaminohydrolase